MAGQISAVQWAGSGRHDKQSIGEWNAGGIWNVMEVFGLYERPLALYGGLDGCSW